MQHPALAEAGRLEGVLRRGRGAQVLRRAAHPRRSRSSSAGAGKRVLEVGCGIGTDSINFARAGAELTAVDLSSESLRIAEQRAEVMGVADRIRFVAGERRGAVVGARGRAVRPRLLVRRHPPHAAPRAGARADAARSRRPAATLKLMVYHRRSWKVFWILVDAGARPVLEDGGARREARGGADRLPRRIHLHAPRRPRARRARRVPGPARCESITCSRTGSATTSSTAT